MSKVESTIGDRGSLDLQTSLKVIWLEWDKSWQKDMLCMVERGRLDMCETSRGSSAGLKLVGCWSFTPWQHLRPYQERYQLWQFYGSAPLWNPAAVTMSGYPTQWHYPDTKLTTLCPILLIMHNARLRSDKYRFDESRVWFELESLTHEACALPIRPPCLVSAQSEYNTLEAHSKEKGREWRQPKLPVWKPTL